MGHKDEYELIGHSHLADCSIFLVELFYRPLHLHKEIELILVLRGRGMVTTERDTIPVGQGDVLLFDSGEVHELHSGDEGLLLLAIQISRSFCKRYCPQLRNTRFHATLIGNCYSVVNMEHFRQRMIMALEAYLDHSMSGAFRCMAQINWIFDSLLSHVPYQVLDQTQMESQVKYNKRIRKVLLYLDEHFREPVRLRDLADMEGITQTHMSHFFRDQLHTTFQDYLCRLRVEAAMCLLKTTDMSVTNISYECGFSDPKYMNHGFLKIVGMSPWQWRDSGIQLTVSDRTGQETTMQHIFTEQECRRYLQDNICSVKN